MSIDINIDGKNFTVPEAISIRRAALDYGIYIPGLCDHPDLNPASCVILNPRVFRGAEEITGTSGKSVGSENSCGLCMVKVVGESGLKLSCETKVSPGMLISSTDAEIIEYRKKALSKILATHPHTCLTCAQREGCSLTQCSSNVPLEERCCILLNRCELGKIVDYIGLPEATPKYIPQNYPLFVDDPFFNREYNLCINCLRCVRICNDVRQVGALGVTYKDNRLWVGTENPGLLVDSFCRLCGACVEVCPTGALLDKSGSKPVRSGDHPPCLKACPAGIDIPEYLKRVAEGDNDSALKAIWNSVPFPGILGYVCFHPCEAECKRGVIDNSLAICAIKRFAYENANVDPIINLIPKVATGKKIAIIGSGPAGLTSAFYLRLAGHYLDVFEAEEKLGGMLRYGIPQYRLPEEVLDDELQNLNNLGINFHLKKRLGSNFNLSDLIVDQYDAVLLTIGANLSINLQLPGGDLPQIYMALDFLSSVKRGNPPPLQGRVVIIGGGNVAVDSAMSARRLGCSEVIMICLEGREEMPAHSWEIKQALEEGITIIPGWGPQEFQAKEGKLYEIIFQQCIKVFDENGKFRPQYQEDNTFTQKTDYAIIAIGQIPDKSLIADFQKLEHRPPLFVAGDASKGPTSVIDAIADGKKIAMEIDKMLGGTGLCDFWPYRKRSDDPVLGKDKNFYQHPVQKPVQTNPVLRIKSFEIIEATFPPEVAREEAYRCLRCNLRTLISPVVLPPDRWQVLTSETIDAVASSEGVYQLADANRKVLKIAGVANLRSALEAELKKQDAGVHFCWELNKMYSQRESELLQNYIKEFGGMPGGGKDDLDDLF